MDFSSPNPSPPLWSPDPERIASSSMMRFLHFINEREGKGFSSYRELYHWSIEEIPAFWQAVRDFFPFRFSREAEAVMVPAPEMRHTRWFPGAELNFAENLLTAYNEDHRHDGRTAFLELNELGGMREISYGELYVQVGKWISAMRGCGIGPGDRVVGYLPNRAVAVIAMLAATSLGAIWSSCSPDFGETGVYDRFRQINPSLIVAADGYTYKGKPCSSFPNLKKLVVELKKDKQLRKVVVIPYLKENGFEVSLPDWAGNLQVSEEEFLAGHDCELVFTPMPFSSPLYILYSSGTTGVPKCIMHGNGHTLIQHAKELGLHTDLRAEDVIFFHTTCGWMMWNWLVSSLFFKATVVLYEGNPFHPHPEVLMEAALRHRFTIFGSGARYFQALEQSRKERHDDQSTRGLLQDLRTVLSTGSPLSDHGYRFIYREINPDVQLSSISGGTDIVSCFVLGSPLLPVYPGEIQCRGLGMAVEVFEEGQSVIGKKGELVCTRPFPSMPIGFYNDPDEEKYRDAYFSSVPGVWCHGDYAEITPREGVIIYGRSDTTLNPGGVRIGTAEIYRVVETFPQVAEAVAVGWEEDSKVVLMLKWVFPPSEEEKPVLFRAIREAIRRQASPRHVPAVIVSVPDIPRTVSGKISEKVIVDLINGREAKNTGALANPECLEFYRGLVVAEG